MSLDNASNMVFVSRNQNAFAVTPPKFEAPAAPQQKVASNAPSTTTKPTLTQDVRAAETRQAETQARVQQKAQRAQTPGLRPADTPNLFAAAFTQETKFKNALSDNLYRRNGNNAARNKLPTSMGTNFASMMDDMTANNQGPSDAINRMATRLDFFEDSTTRASLS
jgi:hypothetical protein